MSGQCSLLLVRFLKRFELVPQPLQASRLGPRPSGLAVEFALQAAAVLVAVGPDERVGIAIVAPITIFAALHMVTPAGAAADYAE